MKRTNIATSWNKNCFPLNIPSLFSVKYHILFHPSIFIRSSWILVQVSTLKQFPNSSFSFWTMPRFVSKRHVEWYRCLKITCSKKGGQLRFWQLWPLRCYTARNPEHSCVLNLSSPIQRLSILLRARDKVGSLQTTFV